nr:heavy metal translocating P-type ATPase [uncultured Agathobaculum sp.]
MSDTNNRLPGEMDKEQAKDLQTPSSPSAEDILARVNVDEIGFPSDLMDDLLSGLEHRTPERPAASVVAEGDRTPEPPQPDASAVDKEMKDDAGQAQPVEESDERPAAVSQEADQTEADELSSDASEENTAEPSEEPVESPQAEAESTIDVQDAAGSKSDVASAVDTDKTTADAEPLPLDETAVTVAEQNKDETAGMMLFERVQYYVRMRRREQTRLRRENARREAAGIEAPYQPMSLMDIRFTLVRLGVAAVFLLLGLLLRNTPAAFPIYLVAYAVTVLPVVAKVAQNCAHGKYFDEYLLILIASLGAFILRNYAEASIVLILHGVGKIVSDVVLNATHKSISQQTMFVPDKATIVNMQGKERHATPSEVRVGDFILVNSDERVPIDGVVLRGDGMVDDTALTGDSEPHPIGKDDRVLAGSLYTGSILLIRATATIDDCALNQVMRVQEDGKERKASLETSAVHGAARVIPIVVVLAILLSVIPPLFNSSTSLPNWIYRALIILVVCCPTAMAISVPLCFSCGTGRLSQRGIHVKGSEAVEKMAELRMVVFDKTGTLTEGKLHVKEIHATKEFNQESVLAYAAAAEQLSSHPVARAVVAAYQSKPQKINEFEEFPGRGVRASIGNRSLLAGNRRLMVARGVKGVPDINGTVVYVAYEGEYAGAIVLEDVIRSEAAEAIKSLKSQGVLRTVILTGDTESPAQQTANAIGIDAVHCGLQPEEKASKMEFLMRTIPTDGTAAYIGDGINDIDELELADVGVAIGAFGSKRTADAANVLIMTNNLMRLNDAMRISRRTHGIAMQNMIFVLLIKVMLVLLTLFGVTYMWQAVAADVLVTVLAVLNAARILGVK